jgi:hypothetical protein
MATKTNIKRTEPVTVRVTRLLKEDKADLESPEHYIGYLVNEWGHPVESPEVGSPIFLSGQGSQQPWIFSTDTVSRIEVYNGQWIVDTEFNHAYLVENARDFH